MKLFYDLPEKDEAAVATLLREDEKRMYCVPYNFEGNDYIEGFLLITNLGIYRVYNGEVKATYRMDELTGFSVEKLFGSGGFYAKQNGVSTLICRFNT